MIEVFHTRIEANGKIQLPPQVLEQLDFEAGQDVELKVEKKIAACFVDTGGTIETGAGFG